MAGYNGRDVKKIHYMMGLALTEEKKKEIEKKNKQTYQQ